MIRTNTEETETMWKLKRNPRIYLAGKISKNDWRHAVVRPCHGESLREYLDYYDFGGEWPIIDRAVFGTFDYVGPYFVSCDHGCAHGPAAHGNGNRGCLEYEDRHTLRPDSRERTRQLCLEAIQRCDVFYAWLDDVTAFGTLVEIGHAEALGKMVVVDGPEIENNELWFGAYAHNWEPFRFVRPRIDPVDSVNVLCATWRAQPSQEVTSPPKEGAAAAARRQLAARQPATAGRQAKSLEAVLDNIARFQS